MDTPYGCRGRVLARGFGPGRWACGTVMVSGSSMLGGSVVGTDDGVTGGMWVGYQRLRWQVEESATGRMMSPWANLFCLGLGDCLKTGTEEDTEADEPRCGIFDCLINKRAVVQALKRRGEGWDSRRSGSRDDGRSRGVE